MNSIIKIIALIGITNISLAGGSEACGKSAVEKSGESSPRPDINNNINKGLFWLAERQQGNGGWGAGHSTEAEATDVANTCISLQAFYRAGHTPGHGTHKEVVNKGLHYVFDEILSSEKETLFVTQNRSTQIQRKLGTYVDTFMASSVLPDFKGKMGSPEAEAKLAKALNVVLAKMEKHQQHDGTWKNAGWAPALSQSLATKGLNKASIKGFSVKPEALESAAREGRKNYDNKSGSFKGKGSAGVDLYSSASNLAAMQDSDNRNRRIRSEVESAWKKERNKTKKNQLRRQLDEIDENKQTLNQARESVVQKLNDEQFIAGFGSNGGEEFLSYMNIGESLLAKGGKEWTTWNAKITDNMKRAQDADGSWKGKHCITGGTFCTSTALLVLMTDKTEI